MKLTIQQYEDAEGYGLFVDGKKVFYYRLGDDPAILLETLGEQLGFDVELAVPQTYNEYEKTWC